MGFINNHIETFITRTEISFSIMDFITDQFGYMQLCDPEPIWKEEDTPLPLCMFLTVVLKMSWTLSK